METWQACNVCPRVLWPLTPASTSTSHGMFDRATALTFEPAGMSASSCKCDMSKHIHFPVLGTGICGGVVHEVPRVVCAISTNAAMFSASTDARTAKEEAKSQRLEAALLQQPGKPASLEEQRACLPSAEWATLILYNPIWVKDGFCVMNFLMFTVT
eukprot:scaffold110190_cov19-Tisochrysis_lutea.AAC.1